MAVRNIAALGRNAMVLCLMTMMSACDDGAQINELKQQQQQFQTHLEQLTQRIGRLDGNRAVQFRMDGLTVQLTEQMFQPVVVASATLHAEGERLPDTLYVDVMLLVEVEQEKHQGISRQVYPLSREGSLISLRQPLPAHGLKPEQVKVSLRPMNWYTAQVIEPQQISYQ